MLYKFELDYKTVKATKDICCVQGETAVDESTVTK